MKKLSIMLFFAFSLLSLIAYAADFGSVTKITEVLVNGGGQILLTLGQPV